MDRRPGGGGIGQYVGAGIGVGIAIRAGIVGGSGIGDTFLTRRNEEDG